MSRRLEDCATVTDAYTVVLDPLGSKTSATQVVAGSEAFEAFEAAGSKVDPYESSERDWTTMVTPSGDTKPN